MFFRIILMSLFVTSILNASIPSHNYYDYMESMQNNSPEFIKMKVVDVKIQLKNNKYRVQIIAEVLEVYKTFTSLNAKDVIFINYDFDQGLSLDEPIPILEKDRIYMAHLIDSVTIFSYSPYAMSKSFH